MLQAIAYAMVVDSIMVPRAEAKMTFQMTLVGTWSVAEEDMG